MWPVERSSSLIRELWARLEPWQRPWTRDRVACGAGGAVGDGRPGRLAGRRPTVEKLFSLPSVFDAAVAETDLLVTSSLALADAVGDTSFSFARREQTASHA